MNILYAEDESFTRKLVTRMLEKEGHSVCGVSNGIIGLKKFLEIKPEIVITDLSMPEMDGFELINRIRKFNSTIPIIITTAYREEVDKISEAVNLCLYKPIINSDLVNAVNSVVQDIIS